MKYKEREFTTHIEIPVRVYFDYQPEEKEERNYPGCPANVEINQILIDTDKAIINDWLMEKFSEGLIDECWKHLD